MKDKKWVSVVVFGLGIFFSVTTVSSLDVLEELKPVFGKTQSQEVQPLFTGISPLVNTGMLINDVTDFAQTGIGESHQLTLNNTQFTSQYFTKATNTSVSNPTFLTNLNNGTVNTNGVSLTPPTFSNKEGQSVTGTVAFMQQIDMTKNWSMSGNFDFTNINTYGVAPTGPGEFLGLILSPTPPNSLATGKGGGGLGILGLANTITWGIDFYDESGASTTYGDTGTVNGVTVINPYYNLFSGGNAGQVVGFRETDSSGNMVPANATDPNRHVLGSLAGTTNTNQNNWNSSNGGTNNTPPLSTPFTISYTYNSSTNQGTVVATLLGRWSDSGLGNDTVATFTNTFILTNTSMSVGFGATSGSSYWSQTGVDLSNFTMQLGIGTTIVHYLDQNGNNLMPTTQFIANTTDTVGINGASTNAATDSYSFDAPTFQGYTLIPTGQTNATSDLTVLGDSVASSGQSTPGNNWAVNYQADYQSAPLTAVSLTPGVNAPVSIPAGDSNNNGVSNGTISFTTTDAQLSVAGFTYDVLAPDGKTYATLTQALTANPTYDTTSNGYAASTDSSPQPFVVQYVADPVTIQYAIMGSDGVIVDETSTLSTRDTLTPTQPTIGQSFDSAIYDNVENTLSTATTDFQTWGVIPQGYHLTGQVFWNNASTSVPQSTLTASNTIADGANAYKGQMIFQYAPDNQEAVMNFAMATPSGTGTPYPNPPSGLPTSVLSDGTTGGNFTFSPLTSVPAGWHIVSITNADGTTTTNTTISGVFDNTNNGVNPASADTSKQVYTVYLAPDSQTLNISYQMPSGYTLDPSAQTQLIAVSNGTFAQVTIPQIAGYTSNYQTSTLNGGAVTSATEIPPITADSTANWNITTGTATPVDNTPQTVVVTYTASARQILLNVASPGVPPSPNPITSGSDGHAYVTDSNYDAVAIPQVTGYTSYVSVNGRSAQLMTTYPSGTFSDTDITLDVTYTAWTAQVNYFVQQQDSSGNNIGSLATLTGNKGSQTGGAGTDFTQNGTNGDWETTASLQSEGVIPQGYHMTDIVWSQKPDGTTSPLITSYTTNWTWNDMTNIAVGDVPQYQAAIVYPYTADTQLANITVTGVPSGQSNISNGSNTLAGMNGSPYQGVTGGTQVVSVPKISGYTVSVTDGSGNLISLNNNTFTITFDSTNNPTGTTSTPVDSNPQTYTIAYTAQKANILVNSVYANTATTNVAQSTSVDTVAYTAPSLPSQVTISTQTGGSYTVSPQNITGYTWLVTDSNGNSYTSSTLPKNFTSDGTNLTYTVTYTPVNATHLFYFYEATYNASGAFTFTQNAVPTLSTQTFTGAVGNIQTYGVTTQNIAVPSGWSLDPMGASLASLTDSTGASDNDNLNGSNQAKRLTFVPGSTNYIIYLSRDIQSVQVNFINDPNNTATQYNDGRTGQSYSVSTSSFSRSGYTYTLTDGSGNVITPNSGTITGIYDATSNANASSPILNNGDGDSNPQVINVTYTADYQEAILQTDSSSPNGANKNVETVTGVTGGAIQFTTTDATLAISGYTYTVKAPDGKSYPSFSTALSNNKTFDTTDNTGNSDSQPQYFVVSYTASYQEANLVTDTTDPTGAQVIETIAGTTGGKIQFDTNDDTKLSRAGYNVTITAPDGSTYPSVASIDNANPNLTFDNTNNGQNQTDSSPQKFVASYVAKAQTVDINYVYSDTDNDGKSGTVPPGDFGTQTVVYSQIKETNAQGDPIAVPTIAGYLPNVTTVTPIFTVNSDGSLQQPTITVTYTAKTETAGISYITGTNNSGTITTGADITNFANNAGLPVTAEGVMNGAIFANGTPPTLKGYTFIGYSILSGTNTSGTNVIASNLSGINFGDVTVAANNVALIYQPAEQQVAIHYTYSTSNNNSLAGQTVTFPNGTTVPTLATGVSNGVDYTLDNGSVNGDNTFNAPSLAGYTATPVKATPDFTIGTSGNLVNPQVNIVYTANAQVANISYKVSDSNPLGNLSDAGTLINGAQTTIQGVTDQTIDFGSATNINGYSIFGIQDSTGSYISGVTDPAQLAETFSANVSENNYTIVYVPNVQTVYVHYVWQLPVGYNGTWTDGSTLTYAANNGQEVSGMSVSTISGWTNATTPTDTGTPPSLVSISGWQWNATSPQTIDWSNINSNGTLNKQDYYFYLAPEKDNLIIDYVNSSAVSLKPYIADTNAAPIYNAEALGGTQWTTSGAFQILGYTYIGNNASANGLTTTTTATTDDTVGPVSTNNTLNYIYQPLSQTVSIVYQNTDPNGKDISTLLGGGQPTTATGLSNAVVNSSSSYTLNNGTVNSDGTFNVPTLKGYIPNVTVAQPNFNLNATNGALVEPTIYLVYQANTDNTANIAYVDNNGLDISQKAVDSSGNPLPVNLRATGATDAAIGTNGAVTIPGYTLQTITYTPYGGAPQTITDVSNAVFSGAETTGSDQLTYTYTPNSQSINVNYVYATGGNAGKNIIGPQQLNGVTDQASGTVASDGTLTNITGTIVPPTSSNLVGYTLITNSPQTVTWNVDNLGHLISPDVTFDYQANPTTALINYGLTNPFNQLNGSVPTGTVVGVQNGLTDQQIPLSGAVQIQGYKFASMTVNGTAVSTADQKNPVYFSPNATVGTSTTTVNYIYTANQGTVTYSYVDTDGNIIDPVANNLPVSDSSTYQTGDLLELTNGTAPTIQGYTVSKTTVSGVDTSTMSTGFPAMPTTDQANVEYQYTANSQSATMEFVDTQGNPIPNVNQQTLSGKTNEVIDYSNVAVNIAGYTLQTDGRLTNQRFGNGSSAQTISMVYSADTQVASVNYWLTTDGTTHQLLAKSQNILGVSNETIPTASIQSVFTGYALIQDARTIVTQFDTDDRVDQQMNMVFSPYKEVAVLQTDSTDPQGATILTETSGGYAFETISFRAGADDTATHTDADLVRKGYSYMVQGPDGTWYQSLSVAIANNATYDTVGSSTPVIASLASPMSTLPKAIQKSLATGILIDREPKNSGVNVGNIFGTVDLLLGSTRASADGLQPTNPLIPFNGTSTSGVDTSSQTFTATYTPLPQAAVVETKNDPAGDKVYATSNGVTGGTITTLNVEDGSDANSGQQASNATGNPNLFRSGYSYTVTGPNGVVYSTLADALSANDIYDNDTSTNQVFTVHYIAQMQTAILETNNTDPKGAKVQETELGESDSDIVFNKDDSNLKRSGYTYKVVGPDGKVYETLKDALVANPTYDNTALPPSGIDPSPQIFTATYTAEMQTVIVSTKNDPTGNRILETQTGASDSKIQLTVTDALLKKPGYTYKVTGPNGKIYTTLAEAQKANPNYDHNDLTNGVDKTPQNFVVTYTANKQIAEIVANGGPKNKKVLETATGDTQSKLKFTQTDKTLHISGYTYTITAPDGKTYKSLSSALKANATYDSSDLSNGKDAKKQIFQVNYQPVQQLAYLTTSEGVKKAKILEKVQGATGKKIKFATTDKVLEKKGYAYKVIGPNGKTYSSLAKALKANATYDNNDLVHGKDKTPQTFKVVYSKEKTPVNPSEENGKGDEQGTLPNNGERKMILMGVIGTILVLLVFIILWKRRKEES